MFLVLNSLINKPMKENWNFKASIIDGDPYFIDGINIWDHPWENSGEDIQIKDPLYNQNYTFTVHVIKTDKSEIIFAAMEFSNCVWGIYQKS